jgi:hypothetical protein
MRRREMIRGKLVQQVNAIVEFRVGRDRAT